MFSEMLVRYAVEMQRDHYRELLGAAQVDQALRQAYPQRALRLPLTWQAFLWLGRRMVNWGLRLQQRYNLAARFPEYSLGTSPAGHAQPSWQVICETQPDLEICLN